MKLAVYTDCHVGAPNELDGIVLKMANDIDSEERRLLSIGDNFDFANVRKKDLTWLRQFQQTFELRCAHSISGNHERLSTANEAIRVNTKSGKKFVFVHGDFESWGEEKAVAYRSKPQTAGFLKRSFLVPAIEWFEENYDRQSKPEFLVRCDSTLTGCDADILICGHLHPKEIKKLKTPLGRKVYILPRGCNELDLEDM